MAAIWEHDVTVSSHDVTSLRWGPQKEIVLDGLAALQVSMP